MKDHGLNPNPPRPHHPQVGVDDARAVAGRVSGTAADTIHPMEIPVEPSDEVLSIVHSGLDFYGQPGGQPVGVSVFFESEGPSFASHAQAMPNSTTIVSLVPTLSTETRTFVSLATDFQPARVRFAIGREGSPRVSDEVIVPVGRKFIVEAEANDEIVSIVHREGMPVGVLVECGESD